MARIQSIAALAAVLLVAVAGSASGATDPTAGSDPDAGYHTVSTDAASPRTFYELEGKKLAPYRCRTAKVAYVRHTLLGFVAYRFWMRRSWCWRYPRVTSVGTETYVTDTDGLNEYDGIVGSSGSWFQWCCRDRRSGHRAFRQAEFRNCIFRYGCLSTAYPWIRMSVRGDGTYTYSVGD